MQRELNKLEEVLLDSPRIPFSHRTLVDEEQFLDQLDLIRLNLPTAFQEAQQLLQQKQEILLEAEQYAQEVMEAAERRAAQIMDETGIVRQAELEASQIRQRVQQECDVIQKQTLDEIDRMRRQAQEELEEIRRQAIAEHEQIQNDADVYADQVLQGMEQQLTELLRVVRNGRQQLQPEPSVVKPSQPKGTLKSPPPKSREAEVKAVGRPPSRSSDRHRKA